MISNKHLRDVILGNFDDGEDEFHIRLFGEDKQHNGRIMWVDFQVFSVAGCNAGDRRRVFQRADDGFTHDYAEAEPVCNGFVKWDGCTQFEVDGHVDDRDSLVQLLRAIEEARRLAAAAMPSEEIAKEYPENRE